MTTNNIDMEMKSLFKSKTFWVNAAAFIVAVLALINEDLLTQLGIPATVQKQVMAIVGFIFAAANIYLRIYTTTAIQTPQRLRKSLTNKNDIP